MKVAIIGAGASGLAAARRAIEYNLEIVIFEKNDHIGGIWRYNEDPADGSSPLYASLRTNLPVQLMEFKNYEFKSESGLCYPPHRDVLKYLNDFAVHYDLLKWIKFSCRVVDVRFENEWIVRVENLLNNSFSTEQYSVDAVMICNGHYSIPFIPTIPGQETFPGQIIHSRVYRRNDPFKGQRLLIVGSGPSGRDIAHECQEVASEVIMSCRSKTEFMFHEDKLIIKPEIKFIRKNRVFFEDDTSADVDVILLCSGYLYDIPFVHESCCVKIHDGNIIEPLYEGFINIEKPSMCFIGYLQRSFIFPLVDLQAEVFVKHVAGRIQLPSHCTMMASFDEENNLKTKVGTSKSHYFHLSKTRVQEYCTRLSYLGDIKPLSPVVFKIYYRNAMRLEQRQRTYLKFEIIDDENFSCSPEE